MNKSIAEVNIFSTYTPFIYISKSLEVYRKKSFMNNNNVLFKQGFVWYSDFIGFEMLSNSLRNYWVEIAESKTLEIDSIIQSNLDKHKNYDYQAIVLPFQINKEERIYVLGDNDSTTILSFTLHQGHYQILFQNRPYTREEIESTPRFNCPDMDFADDEDLFDIPDLCLLTFIPTDRKIEPQILDYRRKQLQAPLVLFDE